MFVTDIIRRAGIYCDDGYGGPQAFGLAGNFLCADGTPRDEALARAEDAFRIVHVSAEQDFGIHFCEAGLEEQAALCRLYSDPLLTVIVAERIHKH